MKRTVSLILAALLLVCMAGSAMAASISYSSWGNANEKATEEAIVAKFIELYPEITVEYIHPDGNYEEKLQIMIAGGEAPDVMSIGSAHIPSFAGAFSPLDLAAVDTDKYITSVLYEGLVYEDMQLAFPKRANTGVVAYNKDLLDQAGVVLPEGEYTIEQFTEDAVAIAAVGEDIYGTEPLWFGQWLRWFGGREVDNDGTIAFNSDLGKEAAQFIVDAAEVNKFSPTRTETEGQDMMQWFISGRVGFKTDFGPYFLPLMGEITSFNWDVSVNPGVGVSSMEVVGVAVSALTNEAEAAQAFAAFVSNSKEAQEIIGMTSAMPVTEEGKAVFLSQYPDKNLQAFYDVMERAELQPMIKGANRIGGTLYGELLGRTKLGASGEEEVGTVLDEAAALAAEVIREAQE